MIGEILRAASPRAIPPADIRRALQQKGVELAFTSIRHALGQLQQRNAAQPVGNTNTWRYRGS
jgi:type II secretory pathway component PulK